jgi:hypothetical protein
MRRRRRSSALVALTIALAGCGGAPAASPGQTAGTSLNPAGSPAPVASAPAATLSDPMDAPMTDVPQGYRVAEEVPFEFQMLHDGLFVGWNMDTAELYRWDASSHEPLETVVLGNQGAFPPDVQAASPGTGGIWVNFPSEMGVGLVDPATGKILRRVEIVGQPYDMIEVGTELWIADFGWAQAVRYDLATDAVVELIPLSAPTDILYAAGAVWLPLHLGRAAEAEPVDAPGGQVVRVDPATNKVVARVKVGHRPYYLAEGFGSIWTGNATSADVSRVDVATNSALSIPVGEDGAFDIDVAGDSVWAVVGPQWPPERVCDPATSFFVRIDPASNAVRERVAFPCAGSITPVDGGFWVSGQGKDGPVSRLFVPAGS